MRYLVACPFVHRPSFDAMRATMHPKLAEHALVIDNTVDNLGAAGSRNVAARWMERTDVDWVVEVSPVTRFGPRGGLDFLAALVAHPDAWVIQSAAPVNWHCIAWSRRLYERVGYWDEHFWPVYGEDGDMSRRIHLAQAEDGLAAVWACVEIDAWITMHGHTVTLAGVEVDHAALWTYYETKWGGPPGHETYTRPFGDPGKPLSWWSERGATP